METEASVPARVLAGRYRLGSLLGRGGMADVFDGYDTRLARPVAVKLLREDMAGHAELRTRFEQEARSAACLSHPNVVAIYDTGEDEGTPFIVMERLPGETMADRLAAGPVPQDWVWRVAVDVLAALGAAHAAGLVHRDVKPGNILLTADGSAKVGDFGIAKSAEAVRGADVTATGLLLGTPAYLAPERLLGQPATPRSDLYSLGVVLYEALAGVKPFEGATPVAVAQAVRSSWPRPLAEVRPDVDPARAAVVDQAMDKDPARRPASADDMAVALGLAPPGDGTTPLADQGPDATLVGAPVLDPPAATAPRRRGPDGGAGTSVRRRRALAALVAGLGVALLAWVLVSAVAEEGGGEGGTDAGRSALAAEVEALADRLRSGDGPRGPEAARRLDALAEDVRRGGGRDAANGLLRDAAAWYADGELSGAALTAMGALLQRIPGVDASVATTTTTSAPAPSRPAVTGGPAAPTVDDGEDSGGEGGEGGEGGKKRGGKGKKGKRARD